MQFRETPIKDAYIIRLDPKKDERGSFCRLFCSKKFENQGLSEKSFVQANLSENPKVGTLRGLHYQNAPHSEAKLVYCIKGRVFDVMVDLRKNSPTYLQHFSLELVENAFQALFIPKGCAHGFLTLTDFATLLYFSSEFYTPESESGVIWNDPTLKIAWPRLPKMISEKDRNLPNLS